MIKEWNLLRTIACLSVVLLHSTTQTGRAVGYPEADFYQFIRILLCYATPTFIVLSEIILANRYPDRLPEKFWSKRFKWIYMPFLSFGIIDALVSYYFNPNLDLGRKIFDNILTGKYVGWFIIVIFQFYLLHYLVTKFKISLTWLFPISLAVMLWYLNLINEGFVLVPGHSHMSKLPFLAWFGYFTLAYIIGKHYHIVAEKLYKYRWITLIYLFIAIFIIYLSFQSGEVAIHSRRIDLFVLVIAITAVILAWGQVIPNFRIINLISNYSFGIYLIHWQVQRFLGPVTANYFNHTSTRVLALFLISLIISMIIIKIISSLPLGTFIVGRVKKNTKPITERQFS